MGLSLPKSNLIFLKKCLDKWVHFRPLIITTNLPLKEIKNETMLDKRRIYDRILEMCTPMYVGGASKREVIASMKMEKAKTLLNTNRGEGECE